MLQGSTFVYLLHHENCIISQIRKAPVRLTDDKSSDYKEYKHHACLN